MQCKQVRDHLSAYLDRELTAELASAIRHHLASCPECRAMLEELRSTADLLGRLPAHSAPADLAGDVRREIERRMLAPQAADETDTGERTLAVHRGRPWPRALALAACLALAVGIGLVAFFGTRPLEPPPTATGPERLARDGAGDTTGGAAPAGGAALKEKAALESADETAPAEAGRRVAREALEPAAPRPPAEAEPPADTEPPPAETAPTVADAAATPDANELAKAPGHRTAKAGPDETAEALGEKAAPKREPAATGPAEPELVQRTMNTVALGQEPVDSLRRAATRRNLDRAPNQLVLRAPTRRAANDDLVRLFARNGWRELDGRTEKDRARRKAPGDRLPPPDLLPAKGDRTDGLYYLAHRNGEDLWVVVTTADDLSRFATQVAQSRTMVVGEDSSRPFQAVRRLQRELASFEAEAGARRLAGDAGTAAAEGAGLRYAGKGPARRPATKAAAEGEAREREGRKKKPGEPELPEDLERQEDAESAPPRGVSPASVAEATSDQPEAPGTAGDGAAGGETRRPEWGQTKAAEKPAEESDRAETKPVAEPSAGQMKAGGPAGRETRREGREASAEEEARQQGAAKEAPPAEVQQRLRPEAIPPDQVMLVVRVRSAEAPAAAVIEATRTEADTETSEPAEPAAAEQHAAPAAEK